MNTIGEVISRLRNQIKSVKQDAFVTDRYLYSLAMKHAEWLIRREDSTYKIMRMSGLLQVLKFVELTELDSAELECLCIRSGTPIKRSVHKLPTIMGGYFGPLIGKVTSLDRNKRVDLTNSLSYQRMSSQRNFKYNTSKYCWIENGYLYFPDLEWEAVRVECLAMGDVSKFGCDDSTECTPMQQLAFPVPDFLFAEMESNVMKDLGIMIQIPSDPLTDNRSLTE